MEADHGLVRTETDICGRVDILAGKLITRNLSHPTSKSSIFMSTSSSSTLTLSQKYNRIQLEDIPVTIDGKEERGKGMACPLFIPLVRPAGRTHLEVQVLYGPDRGNR